MAVAGPNGAGAAAAGSAPARAALAGNPSDGYGGAVLAVTLDTHQARARVGPGPVAAPGLVDAAVARFGREFGRGAGTPISVETDIPLSVGLGGSSAIVLATLRALADHHGVRMDVDAAALLAHSVEVDDLGISAGLQDRLVQSYGGLVFMDFGAERHRVERLDPAGLAPLLVGWRAEAAEASGVVHGGLRERHRRGDPALAAAMGELARWARRARDAVHVADAGALAEAVDASFDIRAGLMALNRRHVEMVTLARAAGAAVNYTGSGGAVICVCNDLGHRDAVAQVLEDAGVQTVAVAPIRSTGRSAGSDR